MSIINNYLKTTYRMGKKRVGFSAINLIGLTMGIAFLTVVYKILEAALTNPAHVLRDE